MTKRHYSAMSARLPHGGQFFVTAEAARMLHAFGGNLHCFEASGGCRARGLFFSRTIPTRALYCELDGQPLADDPLTLTIAPSLADTLKDGVLDFGMHVGRERFLWRKLPAVKTPSCTCLRSNGPPAGKRSPCLDASKETFRDL